MSKIFATCTLFLGIAAVSCMGRRDCSSPGQPVYEEQKAYMCFAEHAPSRGTDKVFLFECKEEGFYPLVHKHHIDVGNGTSVSTTISTCLDAKGNIEIPSLAADTSLYCRPEHYGTWVEVLHPSFHRKVYYRCQDFIKGTPPIHRHYLYSNEEIAGLAASQTPFRDESLAVCDLNEVNVSLDSREIICQVQ